VKSIISNILNFRLAIFIAYFLIFSNNTYANNCKNIHHVILVHGISSTVDKTFGSLEKAIVNHARFETKQCFSFHKFDYDTGNNNKLAIDFSRNLQSFIQKTVKSNKDKISIVAHSQGGIVGLFWLIESYKKTLGFTPSRINQVVSFTTISSPFWGSGFALIGRIFNASSWLDYGKLELREMSYGSDSIYNLFKFFTDLKLSKTQQKMKEKIRILSISGYVKPILPVLNYGHGFMENDIVVGASSARLGFLVANDLRKNYEYSDEWGGNKFLQKDLGEFHIVDGAHMAIPLRGYKGAAKIPESCIADFYCDHGSFQAIYNNVLGHKQILDRKLASKMRSFQLNIQLNVPKDWLQKFNRHKIDIQYLDDNEGNIKFVNSKGNLANVSKVKSQLRIRFDGKFSKRPFYDEGTQVWFPQRKYINFIASGPGLKTRKLKVLVKQSYTTFMTVNMSPSN
jgi:hypothetical protein